MRRSPLALVASLALLAGAGGVAAPSVLAGPTSTEHGVNRAKLAKKATGVIEARNSIDVLKISRCGPKKRKGRLDFGRWVCEWRAEGEWPGKVPYHCAGKAHWKRKKNTWRVDPCKNRLQPMAPLLDTPNPHPLFGFNEDWIFLGNRELDIMGSADGDIARTSLAWWGVEGSPGNYNWYGSDQLYNRLRARGMRPLWVIIGAPCWAQPNPGACENGQDQLRPAQSHFDEMARFAAAAAKRYPDSVGIEIWNEPNYPKFWGGWPEPELYAKMLKESADVIHAEVPGMPVVSAGLSPHADSDKNAIGFSNFLEKMYELGAAQRADAIGIHPYPGVGPAQDYIGDVRVYLGKIQNVMQKYGDSQKGMWATEFGVSSSGEHAFDLGQQATALTGIYDLLRHVNRVDLAVVHRFIEQPNMAGREGGFGVLNPNLKPKPVFCQIAGARGASPSDC